MISREEFAWTGDGFSSGENQIGKSVEIEGRRGVVVSGSDMFITVEWEPWWRRWSRQAVDFVGGGSK